MIRDIIIHLVGDQPMLCDVEAMPTPGDVSLVCTNLRQVDGRKPISTDFLDSWFVIPMAFVRFIEIPQRSLAGTSTGEEPALAGASIAGSTAPSPAPQPEEDSEDVASGDALLRRIREV